MTVQLICCSHSPLMTTDVEESGAGRACGILSRARLLRGGAAQHSIPTCVVVFGPDHFNGFFYELMPAFCIGTAAEGTKDWHLESGPLRVPRELRLLASAICSPRLRRRDLAPDEGRSRHHHSALQAHRRARALQRAAGLHELRRRPAAVVPARARFRRGDRRISRRARTCASPSSARAACRTIRRRRGSK